MPILALAGGLGVAALILLDGLGNAANAMIRKNCNSVVAMVGLNEASERIDSSFQFGIHGKADAEVIYAAQWESYESNLAGRRRLP